MALRSKSTTLLFILFFAGLGVMGWLQFADVPTLDERIRRNSRVLPQLVDLESSAIQKLVITQPDQPQIVLERDQNDGGWVLREPIKARAERNRIETLLSRLVQLRPDPEAGAIDGDPSQFGFNADSPSIELFGVQSETPFCRLVLGDSLESLRYLRGSAEGPIQLGRADAVAPIDQPVDWFRDRSLFGVYSYDTLEFRVEGPEESFRLERDARRWRLKSSGNVPVNQGEVTSLITNFAEVQALEFVDPAATPTVDYGLEPPRRRVSIRSAGLVGPATTQVAVLGNPVPERPELIYARRESDQEIMIVEASSVAIPDLSALRSRSIFDIEPERVIGFEIKVGEQRHRLMKPGTEWRVDAPEPGLADRLEVGNFLQGVLGLQTAEFLSPDPEIEIGFEQPLAVISIWESDDHNVDLSRESESIFGRPPAGSLEVGREARNTTSIYGRRAGDPSTILLLPKTVQSLIPRQPLAFRNRTLLRDDPQQITEISLTRANESQAIQRTKNKQGRLSPWGLIEPVSATADQLVASMLADHLAALRAEALIEEEPDDVAIFGLETPFAVVRWSGDLGSGPHLLRVGGRFSRNPEQRYAALDDRPVVFLIGPKLLKPMETELRERRILAFGPDRLEGITLEVRDQRLSVSRKSDGTWEQTEGDPDSTLSSLDFEALAGAIGSLTAIRFVQHQGSIPPGSGLEPPELLITLSFVGFERKGFIRVGARKENQRFVALGEAGPGTVFLVDDPLLLSIESGPSAIPVDPFAH